MGIPTSDHRISQLVYHKSELLDHPNHTFQCAIVGGGLAGLCLSIQLADQGISVVLFEKNQYPFHKVCGEYISMESRDFLQSLGVPLAELNLPVINQLSISSEKGFMLSHPLGLGGFGISRYTLDHSLARIAEAKGVVVIENCKVNSVDLDNHKVYSVQTSQGVFFAGVVCGSYGKYTPSFIQKNEDYHSGVNAERGNYIGVKYHIKTDLPVNKIELHNFKDGYCGVSAVDQDWYCLCYLTTAKNLSKNGKDIKSMEENVLCRNPHLKRYFSESQFVRAEPLVISNVQFKKKQTNVDGIFLLGDAAGSITPLCGNGMSMGMLASKLLASELLLLFANQQTREQCRNNYDKAWNESFKKRITAGYYLQHLFGKEQLTDYTLKLLDKFPSVTSWLVALTHGQPF